MAGTTKANGSRTPDKAVANVRTVHPCSLRVDWWTVVVSKPDGEMYEGEFTQGNRNGKGNGDRCCCCCYCWLLLLLLLLC